MECGDPAGVQERNSGITQASAGTLVLPLEPASRYHTTCAPITQPNPDMTYICVSPPIPPPSFRPLAPSITTHLLIASPLPRLKRLLLHALPLLPAKRTSLDVLSSSLDVNVHPRQRLCLLPRDINRPTYRHLPPLPSPLRPSVDHFPRTPDHSKQSHCDL